MPKALATFSPLRALVVGTLGVALVTLVLLPFNDRLNEAVPALLLLIPVIAAGALGGRIAAAAVAIEAMFAFTVGFLPPFGSPTVRIGHDLVALALFVVIAVVSGVLIATVVDSQRRQVAADEERIAALEQADQQRSALLRSVSHDLRTPLATIRAVATDLHGDAPFEPAARQELLGLVIDEVERLDRIVANLLSMSRIEAGAFLPDRQSVDIGELVEDCTQRLSRVLERVRVETDVAPDLPLIDLDYSQIDQVLSNLLENAARHSPDGSVVDVVVRQVPAERAGGAPESERRADPPSLLRVQVVDHGSGMAPELREHLFEPFASATGSNSSGVGLAICRSIVEAHGGTIGAAETPGGGATLTVEVPNRV